MPSMQRQPWTPECDSSPKLELTTRLKGYSVSDRGQEREDVFFDNQDLPGRTCILVASDKRTKSLGPHLPSSRSVMSNEKGMCETLED